MRSIVSIAAGIAALLASTAAAPAASTMMMERTPVLMGPQNGSGEVGTALLEDTPKGLVVTLRLRSAKGPQPAHIHKGSCAKLDPKPEYPLHNVVNGMSVTTLPGVTTAQLADKAAINVHKSLTDIPTYVSCGNVLTANMRMQ